MQRLFGNKIRAISVAESKPEPLQGGSLKNRATHPTARDVAARPRHMVPCGAWLVSRMEFAEGIGSCRAAAALALVLAAGRVGVVAQVAICERIPATPRGCASHFDAAAHEVKSCIPLQGKKRKGL